MTKFHAILRFRVVRSLYAAISPLASPQLSRPPNKLGRRAALCLMLAAIACGVCARAAAQANEWTWMGGSDQASQTGVYGTLGTACCRKRTRKPRGCCELETTAAASLALWGSMFVSRQQWSRAILRPFQRPVGVQSFHERMDMDGRKQHSRRQWQASPECTARWEHLLPETFPEAAMHASSWTDSSGNLWLFGG